MRKLFLLVSLPAFLLFACSKSGDTRVYDTFKIDGVMGKYAIFPSPYENIYPNPAIEWNVMNYFEYDLLGRPVKRWLGRGFYTNWDTVIYPSAGHVILLARGDDPQFNVQMQKREIILEGGRIKWKLYYIPNNGSGNPVTDTVEYFYRAGLLTMTKGHFDWADLESDFTYNSSGNLEAVTSFFRINRTGVATDYGWEERFGRYDNASNPLQGVSFWDDLLYRSLSNNNFNDYLFRYGTIGGPGWGGNGWALHYKPNGTVDYSQ
jgi:hypothetical protein